MLILLDFEMVKQKKLRWGNSKVIMMDSLSLP